MVIYDMQIIIIIKTISLAKQIIHFFQETPFITLTMKKNRKIVIQYYFQKLCNI